MFAAARQRNCSKTLLASRFGRRDPAAPVKPTPASGEKVSARIRKWRSFMASDVAVIAGAGPGLSASLARLLTKEGCRVVLAARNVGKLTSLVDETGALAVETDVA